MRHRDFAAYRRDVDDGSFATAEHLRQNRHGAMDSGEKIGIHHVAKIFDGLRFNRPNCNDARVVDQDVDATEMLCRSLNQRLNLSWPAQVGGHDQDAMRRDRSPCKKQRTSTLEFVRFLAVRTIFAP